jgi:hypothetical protein
MGGNSLAAAAGIERHAASEAALGPMQSRFALGWLAVPGSIQAAGMPLGAEPRCH